MKVVGDIEKHNFESAIIKDLVSSEEQIYFKYIPIAKDWGEEEKAQTRWDNTPRLKKFLYRFGPLILASIALYSSYQSKSYETSFRDLTLMFFGIAALYGIGFYFNHRAEKKPAQHRNLIITDQRIISFYDGYDRQNPNHFISIGKEDIKHAFMDYHEGSPVLKLQTKAPSKPVIIARYKIDQVKSALSKLLIPVEPTAS